MLAMHTPLKQVHTHWPQFKYIIEWLHLILCSRLQAPVFNLSSVWRQALSSTNCGCVQHWAFTAAGGFQHRGQQPVQHRGQRRFNYRAALNQPLIPQQCACFCFSPRPHMWSVSYIKMHFIWAWRKRSVLVFYVCKLTKERLYFAGLWEKSAKVVKGVAAQSE